MPRNKNIKKVLVIGSGPIIIGQAAEFDYAGTQACTELKKEGLEVILVNSNPATIMTDKHMADKIYIEPLTVKTVKKIIEKENPDSILPNLGGQTGLNIAMELAEQGYLEEKNIKLLRNLKRRNKERRGQTSLQRHDGKYKRTMHSKQSSKHCRRRSKLRKRNRLTSHSKTSIHFRRNRRRNSIYKVCSNR